MATHTYTWATASMLLDCACRYYCLEPVHVPDLVLHWLVWYALVA
jgi:hypothetical protein